MYEFLQCIEFREVVKCDEIEKKKKKNVLCSTCSATLVFSILSISICIFIFSNVSLSKPSRPLISFFSSIPQAQTKPEFCKKNSVTRTDNGNGGPQRSFIHPASNRTNTHTHTPLETFPPPSPFKVYLNSINWITAQARHPAVTYR